jgi:hypothetical protein
MKQHNYPTLTNYPNLQDATKFDFMARHFEYAQFNKEGSEECTIKVKNLLRILEIFPPNAKKESYFPIGNDSFVLKQDNLKLFLNRGHISSAERTQTHSLGLLNPDANVIFKRTGSPYNGFSASIPVGLHTYEETEFNSERDLYKKYTNDRYNKQKAAGVYTPDPLQDYIKNTFYIQCITEERQRNSYKSWFSLFGM